MPSLSEEERFKIIVDDNREVIYRLCWGFVKNSFDADDLFQEVIINIWKGIKGFRKEAAIKTWIYRITINTCLLSKKRRAKVIKNTQQIPVDFVSESKDEEIHLNASILSMRNAIQQLKKVDKTLILLFLEGCSYKEISEVTGLTPTNVGAKISRIKTKLKKLMQK